MVESTLSTLWTLLKVAFAVVSTFVSTLTSLPFGIGGVISTVLWAGIIIVVYRYSPLWLRRHFKTVAAKLWSFVAPYIGSVFDMALDRLRHRTVSTPVATGVARPAPLAKRSLKQHTLFRARWMAAGGGLVLGIQNWEKIYKMFF